jgi:hypothetical protein
MRELRARGVWHRAGADELPELPHAVALRVTTSPYCPISTITHDAAAGSSAIAVMAKAGHRNMATTRTYLHLAGVVFREEAAALERRLLGSGPSTDLSTSERISDDPNGVGSPVLSG